MLHQMKRILVAIGIDVPLRFVVGFPLFSKIDFGCVGGRDQKVARVDVGHNKMRKVGKDRKNYTMYNETLYEVERVVQIKWVKNRQYCYIKWKGYDERYNTWEPKEHITFCYNYAAPEDKDDPEYKETSLKTPPNSKHQYHTRGKIKPNASLKAICDTDDKDKEDNSVLDPTEPMQSHSSWKPFCERKSSNDLHLKTLKRDRDTKESRDPKDSRDVKESRETADSRESRSREKKETKEPLRRSKAVEEERRVEEGCEEEKNWRVSRDSVVSRILWLSCEEASEKRIGKVEMENGTSAYMFEDILKAHYPEKVIEYYELEMRQRTQKPT